LIRIALVFCYFLSLRSIAISLEISLLLVERYEVKLKEFKPNKAKGPNIKFFASNLLSEELADLFKVKDCLFSSL